MSYVVKLSSKAHRQYKKLPSDVQDDLSQSIVSLTSTPEEHPFLSGQFSDLRKLTFRSSGTPYRLVFTIQDESVIIVFLGTRENFYRELRDYLG